MGYYKKRGRPTKAQQEEKRLHQEKWTKELMSCGGMLSSLSNDTLLVQDDNGTIKIQYQPRVSNTEILNGGGDPR